MRSLVILAIAAFFICVGGQQTPTQAAELFTSGYTNGCFNCGTSVPDSSSAQTAGLLGLQYVNSTFSGTTANSGLALNSVGQAPPTQNTNNLGAFQLSTAPASYSNNTFTLRVTFTAPQGISDSNSLLLTATLTGTVQSTGTGRVTINFDNTPIALTYNDTNCEGDPTTTCGSGKFYLRVEDVGINAGQTVALRGRVFTVQPAAAGQVLISEFRMHGPNGACDDYIELYNNTDNELSIFGYTLFLGSNNGTTAFPVGTLNLSLPARKHFLVTGSAYSLNAYATGDAPLNNCSSTGTSAVGFFNGDLAASNRIDSVLFNDVPANSGVQITFGEGTPLPQTGASTTEHAWVRDLRSGRPQDTNNNIADFLLLSTTGGLVGSVQSILGSPGPENLASPVERNGLLTASYIDPAQCPSCAPNRVRDTNSYVDTLSNPSVPATFNLGRLIIRRTYTNNTSNPITRLRFRVVDITTLNTPNIVGGATQADLRAISSPDESVAITGGGSVQARGLRLEAPSTGAERGGWNSSLTVDFVTPTAPSSTESVMVTGAAEEGQTVALSAPVQPGQSVTVQFWLGVVQSGKFRFFVNVEMLP